jgi:hypothetical protein
MFPSLCYFSVYDMIRLFDKTLTLVPMYCCRPDQQPNLTTLSKTMLIFLQDTRPFTLLLLKEGLVSLGLLKLCHELRLELLDGLGDIALRILGDSENGLATTQALRADSTDELGACLALALLQLLS